MGVVLGAAGADGMDGALVTTGGATGVGAGAGRLRFLLVWGWGGGAC